MNKKDSDKVLKRIERELQNPTWKGMPVSDGNMQKIREFNVFNGARGLEPTSRLHYIKHLRGTAAFLGKPFMEATKEDLVRLFSEYAKGRTTKSVNNAKIACKRFYKWLYGMEEKGEYPEVVKWIKPKPLRNLIEPEMLITPDEMKALLKACTCQRDRALLMVCYEVGPRPHELLSMRVGDLRPTDYGCMITLPDSKTQKRRIPVIDSAPDLMLWLEQHPLRDNAEAPLWVFLHDKTRWGGKDSPISYDGFKGVFRRIKKRAGIKRKMWPYLFRHSALTSLSKEIPEGSLRKAAGWVADSRMPGVYLHLSGADVEEARLKSRGLLPEKQERRKLQARKCPRCEAMNKPDAKFCMKCGLVLDREVALKLQEREEKAGAVLEKLLEDSEFKEFMKEKLRQLGLT
jgi:integrase/ribosomal protein L40E